MSKSAFPHWIYDTSPIPDPFGYGQEAVDFIRALKHPASTAAKRRADIERNQRHGHIAQGLDAIDAHRKTEEGAADYNANRRKKRHADAEREGRTMKTYQRHATKDDAKKALDDAKRAYKDRKKAEFAVLSPDKKREILAEQARKKKEQRERKQHNAYAEGHARRL